MDEGAAFGFFPQLRPRRRLQDPIASADVPLQVLRGRLAGLLGLPADIGNIVRSPMPMEMFGDYEYEKPPQLPYTTEYFLKELPLAPTAPVGQLAGQAASFVPLNPAPLVRGVQKVGTMVGEGMAERVATGRPMLPSLLAEPQAAMFAVEPNVPRMNLLDTPPETMTSLLEVKPQAAVSDLGFYSAAEQAALNLQRNKGSGQAFLNDLLKAENVKKDELQWMGVDDFLKEKPNVTKQEVQDFIANNRVDVKEVTLGGNTAPSQDLLNWMNARSIMTPRNPEGWQELSQKLERYAQQHQKAQGAPETSQRYFSLSEEAGRISEGLDAGGSAAGATKYQKYTLPGGENYREILLTMPEAMPNTSIEIQRFTKRMEAMRELQNEFANAGDMEKAISFAQKADDLQAYIRQLEKIPVTKQTENYQSSHFDEPNILAHIRVNDRVDADGKKMLLIEEIQSDWHQAGREKGYQNKDGKYGEKVSPEEYKRGVDLQNQQRNQAEPLTQSEQAELDDIMGRHMASIPGARVPDAPFKDTWYQLALKRVLKHAADNGYERVGLTTGKQQAERFDLSKQVDELLYKKNEDGTYQLSAQAGGRGNMMGEAIPENKLSDYVGKEVASKITDNVGKDMNLGPNNRPKDMWKSLSDVDLQVGGEGMKKYYDEIYPKFLDKYGKKWNARVGETQITTDYARDANGIPAQRPSKESIRYIDITPEMKGAVSKGQPLFAATPAIPLGAQGLLGEPEKKKELSLLD
jgi:hypothetical protein